MSASTLLSPYTEPVLALAAIISMVTGPFLGFMIPSFLVLLYCLVLSTGIYHTIFLLLMILIGCILEEEFQRKKNWIFYDIMVVCIVIGFYSLFTYLEQGEFSMISLIYPAVISVASCLAIMLSSLVMHRFLYNKDEYRLEEILGDSFILRKQIKDIDPVFYRHCVFCSELCGIVAMQIGADISMAKAAGLYYRFSNLGEDSTIESGMQLGLDFDFPKELMWILYESRGERRRPSTIISGIAFIVNAVVEGFAGDTSAKTAMDYELIVHRVTNELSTSGKLDQCGISMNQFLHIRNLLIEMSGEYDRRFRK